MTGSVSGKSLLAGYQAEAAQKQRSFATKAKDALFSKKTLIAATVVATVAVGFTVLCDAGALKGTKLEEACKTAGPVIWNGAVNVAGYAGSACGAISSLASQAFSGLANLVREPEPEPGFFDRFKPW